MIFERILSLLFFSFERTPLLAYYYAMGWSRNHLQSSVTAPTATVFPGQPVGGALRRHLPVNHSCSPSSLHSTQYSNNHVQYTDRCYAGDGAYHLAFRFLRHVFFEVKFLRHVDSPGQRDAKEWQLDVASTAWR
jgi:hypothetical protein